MIYNAGWANQNHRRGVAELQKALPNCDIRSNPTK